MDVLVIDGRAHELFPDGAPDLNSSLQVIRDYQGTVKENMDWNEDTQTFEYGDECAAPEWIEGVPQTDD